MFLCEISIFVFLAFCSTAFGTRFDRCSVGSKNDEIMVLSDLENNSPKNNELLRSKCFLRARSYLKISQDTKEIVFGDYMNGQNYAIFKTWNDYYKNRYPIDVTRYDFSEKPFTEVDFILKKNGNFAVVIHRQEELVLFWKSDQIFDNSSQINITLYSSDKFMFDCPIS
ncbi:hypothetical protein ACFFRR_003825 [Megaselia abdita]